MPKTERQSSRKERRKNPPAQNGYVAVTRKVFDRLGFGGAIMLQTALAVVTAVGLTAALLHLIKGTVDPDVILIAILVALIVAPILSSYVFHLYFELKRVDERLRVLVTHDELTRVYNRRHFIGQAHKEIAIAERQLKPLSLVTVDIDHFKAVNDKYGHLEGDQVLRAFTQNCVASLRPQDTMARLGGEEFVILLPDTRLQDARAIAERVRQIAEKTPVPVNAPAAKLSISAGVATYRHGSDNFDELLNAADDALQRAKQLGRNKVCVHETDTLPQTKVVAAQAGA